MSRDAPVQSVGGARRVALWLSAIAVCSAIAASWRVVNMLGAQTPARAVLWLALILALTAAAVYGAKAGAAAIVWATTGGVFGFVAIASGSIGVFFVPAGVLLLAASVATSIAKRGRWRALWIPVWLVAGGSAIAAVTLVIASLQSFVIAAPGVSAQSKLVAPTGVVWGGAAFVVLLVTWGARAVTRLFTTRTR